MFYCWFSEETIKWTSIKVQLSNLQWSNKHCVQKGCKLCVIYWELVLLRAVQMWKETECDVPFLLQRRPWPTWNQLTKWATSRRLQSHWEWPVNHSVTMSMPSTPHPGALARTGSSSYSSASAPGQDFSFKTCKYNEVLNLNLLHTSQMQKHYRTVCIAETVWSLSGSPCWWSARLSCGCMRTRPCSETAPLSTLLLESWRHYTTSLSHWKHHWSKASTFKYRWPGTLWAPLLFTIQTTSPALVPALF